MLQSWHVKHSRLVLLIGATLCSAIISVYESLAQTELTIHTPKLTHMVVAAQPFEVLMQMQGRYKRLRQLGQTLRSRTSRNESKIPGPGTA